MLVSTFTDYSVGVDERVNTTCERFKSRPISPHIAHSFWRCEFLLDTSVQINVSRHQPRPLRAEAYSRRSSSVLRDPFYRVVFAGLTVDQFSTNCFLVRRCTSCCTCCVGSRSAETRTATRATARTPTAGAAAARTAATARSISSTTNRPPPPPPPPTSTTHRRLPTVSVSCFDCPVWIR